MLNRLTRTTKRLSRACTGRTRYSALALFAFALLWRALYLHQIAAESPFFDAPVADAHVYFQQAELFATTLGLGDELQRQPPLYPAVLGGLYWLFGANFLAYRLIQFTLGALGVVLLYLIGKRVFSPGVGLLAGAVAALYGPLIYFDGELLPPVLAILLNSSLVLLLLRADTVRRLWSCLAAGLLLGVAGLAAPEVLLFGLGVAGWMFWRTDLGAPSARLGRILLLALGTLLVIGSATLVLSSEQPATWLAPKSLASEEPAASGRSLATKAFDFWQGGEIRHHTDIYFARAHSALLAGLVWHNGLAFPFGIVGPLALAGLLLAILERRAGLVVLFVLCYAGAAVAFSATALYRLPAVPLQILLACYAGGWLKDKVSARQWRIALPAAGLLLLLAWPLNTRAITLPDEPQDRYYVGQTYARKGMPARATLELRKALDLDGGDFYGARLLLGELLVNLDDTAEAQRQFQLLAERFPLRTDPRHHLANLYLGQERIEEAVALFEEIVEIEPTVARSYYGLAGAQRLARRPEAAQDAYLKVLELNPDHFYARYNLAALYQVASRWMEAEQEYLLLIEQRPEHAEVRYNLGFNYLQRREFEAAAEEFSHVLDRNPDHVRARRYLAFAYESLGSNHKAIQELERLVEQGVEEEVYNHLARLYGEMGEPERAREARKKQRMLERREEVFERLREETEQMFRSKL